MVTKDQTSKILLRIVEGKKKLSKRVIIVGVFFNFHIYILLYAINRRWNYPPTQL